MKVVRTVKRSKDRREGKKGSLNSGTVQNWCKIPEREDASNCLLAQFVRFARWSVCQLPLQIWWSQEGLYSWHRQAPWMMWMQLSRSNFSKNLPECEHSERMSWRSDRPIHRRRLILAAVSSLCAFCFVGCECVLHNNLNLVEEKRRFHCLLKTNGNVRCRKAH